MSTLPFFHNYFSLTSKELEGTQGNSRELKGTQSFSREALVEVIEGKNSGKGAKRENLENDRRRKEKT